MAGSAARSATIESKAKMLATKGVDVRMAKAFQSSMLRASPSETLAVRHAGTVAWFTLNRPNKCNALSVGLNQALLDACAALAPATAVVVLEGAGRHFCAGSDLLDLYQVDREEARRVLQLETDACHALAALPQLTVAILHGKCHGGGAILPLYCDLRLGRPGVEFSLPEGSLGWAPPYGIERMEASLRRPFVLDMLLSGRTCGDREALRQGWINHLLGPDPDAEVPYLDQLAQRSPAVLRETIALTAPKNLARMRAADEKALATFLNHFDTDQARAHIARFVERKRPPASP